MRAMSPQSWPKWRFFVFVKMPILLPFIYKDKRKCKLNFPFYCNSRPLCRYNHRETTLPMVPLATPQVISPSHISHPSFKTPRGLQLLLSVGGSSGHTDVKRGTLSLCLAGQANGSRPKETLSLYCRPSGLADHKGTRQHAQLSRQQWTRRSEVL